MKKKYIKLIAISAVLLVVGVSGALYFQRTTGDVPTVTVDGKQVALVDERYIGKMGENEPLANLIQEKGIKPVVVSDNSSFVVKFASLDSKSNYRIITGDDHGWEMDYIPNGQQLDARSSVGYKGKPDKEWLVRVSKYLNYGDKVYEFVLKSE